MKYENVPAEEPKSPIQKTIPPRVINLPAEPGKDNADSLELVLRMPVSGARVNRRFMKTDTVGIIYDFIDQLQNEEKCTFDGINGYTD